MNKNEVTIFRGAGFVGSRLAARFSNGSIFPINMKMIEVITWTKVSISMFRRFGSLD